MALVLLVSGCGSTPTMAPGELFLEYARSTDVVNDRFPTTGESSGDRLANFASFGNPQQIQTLLFTSFDCGLEHGEFPVSRCVLGTPVKKAAESFGGKPHGRTIVVKHADGSIELVTLYVLVDGDRTALTDQDGQTYTGLEDFRANNDLLDSDDLVLTLRDITSVPGEGEFVVVTGHTPATWQWWLLGGLGVLVVVLAAGIVMRRVRHRPAPPAPEGPDRTEV
ncbi:hypothetical protein GCM10027436_09090 [Actinophytocola sediminis]